MTQVTIQAIQATISDFVTGAAASSSNRTAGGAHAGRHSGTIGGSGAGWEVNLEVEDENVRLGKVVIKLTMDNLSYNDVVEFKDANYKANVIQREWSKSLDFDPKVIQNFGWRIYYKGIHENVIINLRNESRMIFRGKFVLRKYRKFRGRNFLRWKECNTLKKMTKISKIKAQPMWLRDRCSW